MRKITVSLVVFCLILIIENAAAIPASPYPFTLEQPDGYSFQARQYGDERLHWIETLDGYTIVKEENGWWTYAAKNNEGKLIPTNNRVRMVKPLSIDIEKHVTPIWKPDDIMIRKSSPRPVKIKTLDLKANGLPGTASATTEKVVVILINFTDVSPESTHDKTYYDNLIFNNSTGANSMFNYYREVSYDQLNITGTTVSNWYQSSHKMEYYGEDATDIDENITRSDPNTGYIENLAREAVQLADDDIDFSEYDTDSDEVVDHVIIVHAGNAQESSDDPDDIWSHQSSIGNYNSGSWHEDGEMTNDGVKVIGYTMMAEGSPLGTFAHEFFHDLGAPDLYDYDSDSNPVSYWDLMAGGSWNDKGNTPAHMGGYLKWDIDADPTNGYNGWLTPIIVSTPQTRSVEKLESDTGDRLFKVDISGTNQYFLVENRQLTGYDAYLPEAGILIWHIDEDVVSYYNDTKDGWVLMNDGPPWNPYFRAWVEDPSGTTYKSGAAYSFDDGQAVFNTTTSPNSSQNNCTPSGIEIYNIGAESTSMSVTFTSFDNIPPTVVETSPTNQEVNVEIDTNITATFSEPMNSSTLNNNTVKVYIQEKIAGETFEDTFGTWNSTNFGG
ncbi:MAG: M6 family metalloprotease domain-containing protein, partial [Methanosarcinales archaeon]|nr:M6 family metalloprotease domain-containing protein [Methanosarcinales archaeon]